MEQVSLSRKEINEAIQKIQTAHCCMTEDWFDWTEKSIVRTEVNMRSFNELKRKCLARELFLIRELNAPSEIKKMYAPDASLKFSSKEFILIGKGEHTREVRLTLSLPISEIIKVLSPTKNVVEYVTVSHISKRRDVYLIVCRDKAIVKRLKDEELNMVLLMCEVLQLSDDYHVYDCSSYDVSALSNDNILSNLHRFRKLL